MSKYFEIKTFNETVSYLRSKLPADLQSIKLGVVCGSGLGGLVDCFDSTPVEFSYSDIPHFIQSTVPGHAGKLVFGTMSGIPTVCMLGRMHLYEGHALNQTVYPIRIMKLLGCTHLIVTNAAGGLNPNFQIGDFMIIKDHISFAGMAGQNPLIGKNIEELGPRFPPVSSAYDYEMRVVAARASVDLKLEGVREGNYSFVVGPSFETRAEARFLRDRLGGDCVGMSTVPEVIAAKHCGLKVLGLSLITNKVAVAVGRSALDYVNGIAADGQDEMQLASHEEVLETAKTRGVVFTAFVKRIVSMLPEII